MNVLITLNYPKARKNWSVILNLVEKNFNFSFENYSCDFPWIGIDFNIKEGYVC